MGGRFDPHDSQLHLETSSRPLIIGNSFEIFAPWLFLVTNGFEPVTQSIMNKNIARNKEKNCDLKKNVEKFI